MYVHRASILQSPEPILKGMLPLHVVDSDGDFHGVHSWTLASHAVFIFIDMSSDLHDAVDIIWTSTCQKIDACWYVAVLSLPVHRHGVHRHVHPPG
eukprot:2978282-Amphidinium_carterae.1